MRKLFTNPIDAISIAATIGEVKMKILCIARLDTETNEVEQYYELCHPINPEKVQDVKPEHVLNVEADLIKAQTKIIEETVRDHTRIKMIICALNSPNRQNAYRNNDLVDAAYESVQHHVDASKNLENSKSTE